jgi:hypothetical protein
MSELTTIDVLAIVGAVCALLMVAGSLYLLNKGAITLRQVDPQEAIKVEFQRVLNIQTRNPAIALFVVGVIFLCVSFWFAQENAVRPLTVTGELQSEDPDNAQVRFLDELGNSSPTSTGEIRQQVWPKIDRIQVEITTPGHLPPKRTATAFLDKDRNVLSFGTVKAGKKVASDPVTDANQIEK